MELGIQSTEWCRSGIHEQEEREEGGKGGGRSFIYNSILPEPASHLTKLLEPTFGAT